MATKDDIEEIRDEIEVRAKWRRIGLELELTPGTLDAIKQREANPSDRLEAVLRDWLQGETVATWKQLIDALRSAPVGATELARKLELEHCSASQDSPTIHTQTAPREKRKYMSDGKQQLTNDIKTIERKYVRLQTATRESLKSKSVDLSSLRALLTSYQASRAVIKRESNMLLADKRDDLERAASVDEIFVIVSPFWSFLDFEILEDVIELFGADSDRQNLAEYVTELKKFLNSWQVSPCKISRLDDNESRKKICIKLDTDSLEIYRDIKIAVARIFEVDVYALHLHSIEDGCIQLIFILPAIVHIIVTKRDQLAQIHPSVLKISLSRGSTREVIFEREDQNPSQGTSLPPLKMRQSASGLGDGIERGSYAHSDLDLNTQPIQASGHQQLPISSLYRGGASLYAAQEEVKEQIREELKAEIELLKQSTIVELQEKHEEQWKVTLEKDVAEKELAKEKLDFANRTKENEAEEKEVEEKDQNKIKELIEAQEVQIRVLNTDMQRLQKTIDDMDIKMRFLNETQNQGSTHLKLDSSSSRKLSVRAERTEEQIKNKEFEKPMREKFAGMALNEAVTENSEQREERIKLILDNELEERMWETFAEVNVPSATGASKLQGDNKNVSPMASHSPSPSRSPVNVSTPPPTPPTPTTGQEQTN